MGINMMLVEVGDIHSDILFSFHLFLFQTVGLPVKQSSKDKGECTIESVGTSCPFPWKQSRETDNDHHDNNHLYSYLQVVIYIITLLIITLNYHT